MEYGKRLLEVIKGVIHEGTYKLALARAILECLHSDEYEEFDGKIIISEYQIAQKTMRYYWNLVGFFELEQGSSSPLTVLIDDIKSSFYSRHKIPYRVWFDKIESDLKRYPLRYEKEVKKFITLNRGHAIQKFKVKRTDHLDLFHYDRGLKILLFNEEEVTYLKNNYEMLDTLIDYQWAKVLEGYNKSPNIIRKVIGSKERVIKRPNLIKFRNLLLQYDHLEGITDFYTGNHLKLDEISLEHVIPFHFIYSVDLWNIVIVNKNTIKKVRGKMPSKDDIDRLENRNKRLLESLSGTKLKPKLDLERAVNQNLVRRFYIDLKS